MTTRMINRRGLLFGLGSLLAAPAIVRATSIMPVRAMPALEPVGDLLAHASERVAYGWIDARVIGYGVWGQPTSEVVRFGPTLLVPKRFIRISELLVEARREAETSG